MALLVLLALGCATRVKDPTVPAEAAEAERLEQTRLALSLLLDRQLHGWLVGSRLRTAGVELCGEKVRHSFGFFAIDRETFSKDYGEVAPDLGIGPGVRIWATLPEFEDTASSLARGDRILRVAGRAVADFGDFERAMEEPFRTGRLTLHLERHERRIDVSLAGRPACDFRVGVVLDDDINAAADGRTVIVTSGMLRFVESDDELALVLGHEFAHNALGHVRQMQAQVVAGMLADLAAAIFGGVDTRGLFSRMGRLAYSEAFEAEADYTGLYFGARAGYEIDIAPAFWRRMAVEHPGGIADSMLKTHPSSAARAVALRRTIAEIEAKRDAGEPLIPTYGGEGEMF